jgi:hypothetical protein
MCPLILSYLVFNSTRYQIIHVHGKTKPTLSKALLVLGGAGELHDWVSKRTLLRGSLLVLAWSSFKYHALWSKFIAQCMHCSGAAKWAPV